MSKGRSSRKAGPPPPKERRRWCHLRPLPRRRTDLMGFNTTWWVLLWLILIVLLVYPAPWWL
jgi:hypothetical protein